MKNKFTGCREPGDDIAELTPLLTYVYDLDRRYNTYVAGSLFRHWGFWPDVIDSMSPDFLRLLTHEDDRARLGAHHDAMRSMNEDSVREIEYRIKISSGQWRWLVSRDRPFARDRNGRVTQILCIAEEIVDRAPPFAK